MSNPKYGERLSIGFTLDQLRRLEEIVRVRARKGQGLTKADLVRDALEFYLLHQEDLPGSRKAIAKSVEGKIALLEEKLEHLSSRLAEFFGWLEARVRK